MTEMISSSSPPFLMKVLSGARRKKNKLRLKLNFAKQSSLTLFLLTVIAVLTNGSMALSDKSLPKSCSE